MFLILLTIMFLLIILNETIEINYQGISLTWRRFLSWNSNVIRVEMIITLALSDKSFHLCDSHHPKSYEMESHFGIECLDSWDQCLSWPLHHLSIECHSKTHEYPKSLISKEFNLTIPSDPMLKNIPYKFRFPSSNSSCCWEGLDPSVYPVQLISTLSIISIDSLNSPPIARFPAQLVIELHKDFLYSLEVFDPDGDFFECQSLRLIPSIVVSPNCFIRVQSNSSIVENEILIQIEIIEYLNKTTNEIRSRLSYQIIAFIDHDMKKVPCSKSPSINLLNIENGIIHVRLNESVSIEIRSESSCSVPMEECLIDSPFHWRLKSIVEKSEINLSNEMKTEFEWIPRNLSQCGYHIHCVRCLDQFSNYLDQCLNLFVYGKSCQNVFDEICSWSPFTNWRKHNQTMYKRSRTCQKKFSSTNCSFCFGSSIQFQSSLAFTKDLELFEQSLSSPRRAHSTMEVILIISMVGLISLIIGLFLSFYFLIKQK